jgi:hypothetical protein
MAYVAAFLMAPFGACERAWKPFNSLLGETFELEGLGPAKDGRFLAEQVRGGERGAARCRRNRKGSFVRGRGAARKGSRPRGMDRAGAQRRRRQRSGGSAAAAAPRRQRRGGSAAAAAQRRQRSGGSAAAAAQRRQRSGGGAAATAQRHGKL